jgi:hypothetical protein
MWTCSGQSRRRQHAVSRAIMVETRRIIVTEMQMISSAPPGVASYRDMRSLGRGLVLLALVLSCAGCGQSSTVLTAFRTEEQARTHCPKDTVVWLDPQSGLYYFKGQGPYGRSNSGRYACRTEADAAGMHAMPN